MFQRGRGTAFRTTDITRIFERKKPKLFADKPCCVLPNRREETPGEIGCKVGKKTVPVCLEESHGGRLRPDVLGYGWRESGTSNVSPAEAIAP